MIYFRDVVATDDDQARNAGKKNHDNGEKGSDVGVILKFSHSQPKIIKTSEAKRRSKILAQSFPFVP